MKAEGDRKAAEIFEAAQIEIEQEKRDAEKKVSAQIVEARKGLEAESQMLAATIMEKVLERKVTP
jgi:F0F1-type ATP synthase membrane subunit b/b'